MIPQKTTFLHAEGWENVHALSGGPHLSGRKDMLAYALKELSSISYQQASDPSWNPPPGFEEMIQSYPEALEGLRLSTDVQGSSACLGSPGEAFRYGA